MSEGLGWICPKRRHDRRPPTFVGSGSDHDEKKRYEPWVFSRRPPDDRTVRKMFCMAVEVLVKRTMSLHDFKLDDKVFRQGEGGSIGLDLTGVVSDIFMVYWDKKLLTGMTEEGLEPVVYKRYKDDVNVVIEEGMMVRDLTIVENRQQREQRVMEKVKLLAESIEQSIKVETDVGTNHPERKERLPILDIEVWVGDSVTGEKKILHSHYMKDVASRCVMSFRSAHGLTTKRNVLVNEICRIMKNCSVYGSWGELAEKVSYFMRRMEFSEYSEQFRYEVLKMAFARHDGKVRRWETGGSMFEVSREEYRTKKAVKKRDWFRADGKYESVMFVQPTPGSVLKAKVQKIARKNRLRIKVVEKAGLTVKKVLQRSDPYERHSCGRVGCPMCDCGRYGECWSRGCVYQWMCKDDERKYRGQTGRSVFERTKEEIRDWRNQKDFSPLWKHSLLYHNGEDFEVDIRVKSKDFGKPSRRLITEAVLIENLVDEQTMNSRREWTYTNLNKIRVP